MSENEFTGSMQEAPAAPTLSFGEETKEQEAPAPKEAKAPEMPKQEDLSETLTAEELAQVRAFEKSIDLSNTNGILNYGAGTQKKMADFSQKTLDDVRTKDMGEVGDMLTNLVTQLKNFDVDEEEKGLRGFFHRQQNKAEALKARYAKVETNVDTVTSQLEQHQVRLMKDADLMDRMYELNLSYFKELTMYIVAGKEKLAEERSTTLVQLQQKAQVSGLPEDAQKAKDYAAQCDRFEKKLYDLELTRTIAMQQAPQIRMVQTADITMAEKIQSTIVNTIPLWKNQMVIAMGLEHSNQAAKAEQEVSEMTNELLKKNADALKTATVTAAKESERGIVDIETLKHTNESLISAMDEILTIQKEGKEKRAAAEGELSQIEDELKKKLLEAAKS
ncbi:MAG: toxic anion resistance protein [Lachnospiraceae bacterium]|nr:toxic anion resistance protein [Lachnospiraceae bacterium]MCI1423369.1 toxic anion resistance protein [Lachnospiraceae bacterium]MCI1452214.1 toxic anion resistance protein [Lachnospiraceae bacterium]MDD5847769.1 toxic anion resistance protein [Bacillota bacterium]